MRLTMHVDLSLRVLMYLALKPEELRTVSEIAECYQVSRNHLVKVVHGLSSLGYIRSTQGRSGGIALGMKPDKIVVADVVRDMEPNLDIVDCGATSCPLLPACQLRSALDEARDAFMDVLATYTVADLTRNRQRLVKLIG